MFGACRNAFAAGNTFFFVNDSNAVNDFNCAECTGFFAAAQTQTAIRTAFCTAAGKLYCHIAVINAEVIIFFFCFFASTAAFYKSSNGFGSGSFDTHNGADFFCYCSTANRAGIYRCAACCNCGSTAAAAGEAAAAAVCAGQNFQNFTDLRVFFYFENLAGYAKACSKNNTKAADAQDRINNTHNVHFCHTPCFTV